MVETPREGDQPLPLIHADVPDIQSAVIDDIQNMKGIPEYVRELLVGYIGERREVGIKRYGTAVQPFNGRDAVRDAFEEAVDLVVYLKQVVTEGNHSFMPSYYKALNLLVGLKELMP